MFFLQPEYRNEMLLIFLFYYFKGESARSEQPFEKCVLLTCVSSCCVGGPFFICNDFTKDSKCVIGLGYFLYFIVEKLKLALLPFVFPHKLQLNSTKYTLSAKFVKLYTKYFAYILISK